MERGAGRPQRLWRNWRQLVERINKIKKRMARITMSKPAGTLRSCTILRAYVAPSCLGGQRPPRRG
eukprot:6713375-Pyramimonas_sp.AAC.1